MRSRAGYWIGGGLIVVGVLGAVAFFVSSFARLNDQVDDFQRVPLPGKATVELEARKYVIYSESATSGDAGLPFEVEIIEGRTGTSLDIADYGAELTYSLSGREGIARATVTPARPGAYVVRADSRVRTSGARLALGGSLAWPLLRGILGSFVIGGLGVGSGAALLIVTAVRRSRARRGGVETTVVSTGPLGQPRGIGFGILLYIITFGVYGVYWAYKTHEELKQHTGEGLGGVLGLVVWLLVNPVSSFVMPSEIGNMYRKDGQEPPVTGWTGLWLFPGAILLVPAIVWFVKVQRALNRYWERKAQLASAVA